MASLNKVMLIGHLGKDPEIISFENGTKKMSVTLATTERYRDRNGEWAEQTDWHNLVAWGNLALDIAEKRRNYIKGDFMYVEGRLKTRQYVDSQNVTRYVTEVLVDKMMSMGTKRQSNPEQANASYNSYQQSAVSYQQVAPSYQQQAVSNQQPVPSYEPAPVEYQSMPTVEQPVMSAPQPSFNSPSLPPMPDPGYDGGDLPF
jgi:single-strand DNA-binding protein